VSSLPAVHVIIPTHTTRHLAACLAGLARQTVMPVSVAISCDTDDPAIGELLNRVELPACRVAQVSRKHQGWPHPAQVRNNAFRGLENLGRLADRDVLLGIDGDIVLCQEAIARHAALAARGAELTIGFRMCLDEAATGRFAGAFDLELASREEAASLANRDRRYRRQLAMRRIPFVGPLLVKPHKPKLISAHYAVTVKRFREVNGFDEEYTHYGYEDDDLGRRLHAAGARCAIGVGAVPALHLWHPSRAPARPTEAPGYQRFCMQLPTRAAHGLSEGLPQPQVSVRTVRA
jgi:hypothetical protein